MPRREDGLGQLQYCAQGFCGGFDDGFDNILNYVHAVGKEISEAVSAHDAPATTHAAALHIGCGDSRVGRPKVEILLEIGHIGQVGQEVVHALVKGIVAGQLLVVGREGGRNRLWGKSADACSLRCN